MATKPPQTKVPPPLKIPVAWGHDGNPIYAEEIRPESVALIKSKMPRDYDGNSVEPNVGNDDIRAHFFVVGQHFSGNGLCRAESSERHEGALKMLLRNLKNAGNKIDIFTSGPVNPKTQWRDKVLKFSLLDCCKYQWIKEPETRIWMDQNDYLQPDIAGRDITRFAASPKYPAILIEVVHKHWPDQETWGALVELSKRNHFVAFYVITEEDLVWEMNALKSRDADRMSLHIQIYLQDGVLYDGKEIVHIHGSNATERYKSAHGYLSRVKEKYLLERKKRDEYKAEQQRRRDAEDQKGGE